MTVFHPQFNIDDFYVRLYILSPLSFYIVIVPSRKKESRSVYVRESSMEFY